jgi:c-di-GMP-binding flagellar brake protein YcgR
MKFTRDRRDYRIKADGSSVARNSARVDTRTGTDRRSGKDRRHDYDEQRKLVRYKLNTSISIVLEQPRLFNVLPPHKTKLILVDISLGGLRAQYASSEMFLYKQNTLSIETDNGVIKIENIPFKIISDYKYTRLPGNTYLRRCGIKFSDLSENHKRQLNKLIQNYS